MRADRGKLPSPIKLNFYRVDTAARDLREEGFPSSVPDSSARTRDRDQHKLSVYCNYCVAAAQDMTRVTLK